MKKVIIMVRTSTEGQQIEDQHNEMVQFCRDLGYSDEQMVFVETQGASAAKVDEDYLFMLERVKTEILRDKDINCFAVWHINRAARNEKMFYEIKDFMIKNGVQFIVKNPYLKLLNEDGSVNMGMELAFSLMATLAKQDNEERIAKFKRAKTAMKAQGKFTGGRCTKYGYKVGKDNYIEIDEEVAPVVRKIFELYATGEYSVRTLYDEMCERGYAVNYHLINRVVADTSYIGYSEDKIYPRMVSDELWEKCKAVREHNFLSVPKGHKYCFGSGVYKCNCCGRNMIAEGDQYRCWHHNKYSAPPHCDNGMTTRVDNLDGLLWWVASKEEIMWRMKMTDEKKEDYEGKIKILEEKMDATKKKFDYLKEKRKRITESYIDGVIDRKERDKKLLKVTEQEKEYNESLVAYTEQIDRLKSLLEDSDKDKITEEKLKNIYIGIVGEDDLKLMNEIVKKQIKKVVSTPLFFGRHRDKRAVRENAQLITIETSLGDIQKYVYVARGYNGHHFWFWREDGKEKPILTIHPIKREKLKTDEKRIFKKISKW